MREGLLGGGGGQAPWSCPSVYRLFPHPGLYQADFFISALVTSVTGPQK